MLFLHINIMGQYFPHKHYEAIFLHTNIARQYLYINGMKIDLLIMWRSSPHKDYVATFQT